MPHLFPGTLLHLTSRAIHSNALPRWAQTLDPDHAAKIRLDMIQDGSYIQRFPCFVEYSHPQSEASRRHFACDFNSRGATQYSLRAVIVSCCSNQNNRLSRLAPYIQFRLQIMDDDQEYIHDELRVDEQPLFAEYQVNFSFLVGICTNLAPSTAITNFCWQEASIIDSSEITLILLHALQHPIRSTMSRI